MLKRCSGFSKNGDMFSTMFTILGRLALLEYSYRPRLAYEGYTL
ncbi:MAG: hypothetical protein QXZ66_01190 [Thermoproteota archaeon]